MRSGERGGKLRGMYKHLLALSAAVALVVPATASAENYTGKTKGGARITFSVNGNKISKIRTVVLSSCFEPTYSMTRGGGELFQPPGSFRLGAQQQRKAYQPAALHQGIKATKTYTVKTKATRRAISGTLRVSLSFLTLGPDPYHSYIWYCTGTTTFSVKR